MSTPEVHHDQKPHWAADGSKTWVKVVDGEVYVSAKAMNIRWGGDERFWRWIQIPESRFPEAAELVQVSWMEVNGTLDTAMYQLSPSQQYEIVYVIKFKDDAFGLEEAPVTFHLTPPGGNSQELRQKLVPSSGEWKHVHGGKFTTTPEHKDGKLHFAMTEVESDVWKGGMILDGVIIRPKSTA